MTLQERSLASMPPLEESTLVLDFLLKMVNKEDQKALNSLGVLYATGRGVAQDYKQAMHWYRRAAKQGYPEAQNNIGLLYVSGLGVGRNYEKAIHWFTLAAKQGHPKAQNSLGILYATGLEPDYEKAMQWFTLAAEQGHAEAQNSIGLLYAGGRGVLQNDAKALFWYRRAANQGYAPAQFCIGVLYATGRGVAQDYKEAMHWFTLAAEQGHAEAQNSIGLLYANGQGVAQDYKEAMHRFTIAANQGCALALNNIATLYATGRGVARDDDEAKFWYRCAANTNVYNFNVNVPLGVTNYPEPYELYEETEIENNSEIENQIEIEDNVIIQLTQTEPEKPAGDNVINFEDILSDTRNFVRSENEKYSLNLPDSAIEAVAQQNARQICEIVPFPQPAPPVAVETGLTISEKPSPLALPDEAPKLYTNRPKGQGVIEFLRDPEGWWPYIEAGLLTRPDLRRLDEKADKALENWLGKNKKLPEGMRIPTKSEVIDQMAAAFPNAAERPARLDWAMRGRAHRAKLI